MTAPMTTEQSAMLFDLMRGRRSVRRFSPEPVPRAVLERVLEAAVTAPSASNKQPWHFFVVTDRARIERMAAAVRAEVDRIAAHVPPRARPLFARTAITSPASSAPRW